jgi:hypothetical protein
LVGESEAEVVIHQLTAFGIKDGDPYAETIRVRIDGTRCHSCSNPVRQEGNVGCQSNSRFALAFDAG